MEGCRRVSRAPFGVRSSAVWFVFSSGRPVRRMAPTEGKHASWRLPGPCWPPLGSSRFARKKKIIKPKKNRLSLRECSCIPQPVPLRRRTFRGRGTKSRPLPTALFACALAWGGDPRSRYPPPLERNSLANTSGAGRRFPHRSRASRAWESGGRWDGLAPPPCRYSYRSGRATGVFLLHFASPLARRRCASGPGRMQGKSSNIFFFPFDLEHHQSGHHGQSNENSCGLCARRLLFERPKEIRRERVPRQDHSGAQHIVGQLARM